MLQPQPMRTCAPHASCPHLATQISARATVTVRVGVLVCLHSLGRTVVAVVPETLACGLGRFLWKCQHGREAQQGRAKQVESRTRQQQKESINTATHDSSTEARSCFFRSSKAIQQCTPSKARGTQRGARCQVTLQHVFRHSSFLHCESLLSTFSII